MSEYDTANEHVLCFQIGKLKRRIADLSLALGLITTLLEAENERLKEELQYEKTRSQLNLEAEERRMLNITYYCAEIDRLNARIAELETERKWIPVSERLPEAKESVLALVKSKWSGELYIERACYIPPKSIRADDFFLDDLEDESVEEYDEELDLYWVAEGWWEDSHEANVNWKITGEVIGWWELPKIEVEAWEVQE